MNKEILKKKFSIGHNGHPDFMKLVEKYKDYIGEIYFGPSYWVTPSTRPSNKTFDSNYTRLIKSHIDLVYQNNYNIKFSLLLNSQCWNGEFRSPQLLQKIMDYIELLEYKFDDIVVSDPFLAKVLQPLIPDKSFTTSIISALNDLDMILEFLKEFPDFKTICVGHKLTYNIDEIKRIKEKTRKKIKLLVNQGCYYSCPDYILHSTALAHSIKYLSPIEEGKLLYCDKMNSQLNDESWRNLTHQALSPKYIEFYTDYIDIFKISTRIEYDLDRLDTIIDGFVRGDTKIFAKKLFMGGGRSVGYKIAAIFSMVEYPNDYLEVRNKCGNKCYQCSYCKNLWKKAEEKFFTMPEENLPKEDDLYFKKKKVIMPL